RRRARKAKLAARGAARAAHDNNATRARVYGDAAYGSGAFLDHLADHHIDSSCKVQPPVASGGRLTKDAFAIDLEADTVTCPNQVTVTIHRGPGGDGVARFGESCASCPLRASCTESPGGRSIQIGRYEHRLAQARAEQAEPDWTEDYRATRPKVERKLAHLMRRRHGGRRARVRGRRKVDADFNLLAAAQNLGRLATLGLHSTMTGWAVAPT
ncbi:MAG: transposase, partial [Acidimicrobiales bacterium]